MIKESYYLTNKDGEKLTEKLEIDMIDMGIRKRTCYIENIDIPLICKITGLSKEELKQLI